MSPPKSIAPDPPTGYPAAVDPSRVEGLRWVRRCVAIPYTAAATSRGAQDNL